MKIKSFNVAVALLSVLSIAAGGSQQQVDGKEEVNKMKDMIGSIEKPSPAMVNAVLDQFRQSCRTNRTIDEESIGKNMSTCMEGLFNQTDFAAELEEAIPKGNLDNVFRKICLKWPKVKGCAKGALDVIEECWENGTMVTTGLDTMVDFFCGKENNGAYIALFFAEGGLTCLEKYGDKVRDCVNEQNTDEHQEDLCVSVHQVFNCLGPLRSCDDVTPHNLVTSMMQQVGYVMKCPPVVFPHHYHIEGSGGTTSSPLAGSILATLLFLSI